jgi:O-antigen ligase
MILGVAVTTVLLVSTQNPVGSRYRSIFAGNILLFTQPSFGPGVYFNGAQFRLLEWRFTYEILNEQKAWLLGLTPGDAQSFLDRKYHETNKYTGVPGTEKRGFLGYHTHNQFLQSLLENGLLGLAIFAWICCTMLIMAQQGKSNELKWIIGLLIAYCFTDAPFQTQYGIIIFTLFPCLVFLSSVRNAPQQSTLERQHPELLNNEKQPN